MRDQKDLHCSLVNQERERTLMRQIDNRYEYRDCVREEFERECNRDQKLENEKYALDINLYIINHCLCV